MKSDPLSSVPHIILTEDWLLCYVYLRFELYLLYKHYGNFGKLGPKSWVGTHKKGSKILFTLLIKLSLTLFSRLTYVLVLWVFVHWGNFDKVDRNTPKSFVGTWKIIQSFYSSTFHMRWGHKQTSWLSESQNHFCLLFLGSSSHLGHLIRQLHFTTLNSIIYCNLFKFLKTE